ncbi:MAG: phosphohistidine swiveling domain-containing protein, partial [Gammaproteobacteria bacterium]
ERGFREGTERYGLFLDYLMSEQLHGFSYSKVVLAFVPPDAPPGPPSEGFFDQPALIARFENGKKAIENKIWHEDMQRWDDEIKPDSIRRNRQLQQVQPETLDSEALIQHLVDCYENLNEMTYRHHLFTIPSLIPVGLYIGKACEWTGADAGEALNLLKGSSPVSLGLAAAELTEIGCLLRQEKIDRDRFKGLSPTDELESLSKLPNPIGIAIEQYIDIVGYQLTSGYDITERFALEMPEILVGNIWSSRKEKDSRAELDAHQQRVTDFRNRVPAVHRAEFDSLLQEARFINRLRDERGVYNESRALGLSRRAVLEAGSRLQNSGRLNNAAAMLQASHEEMLAMLAGNDKPDQAELDDREDWYQTRTTEDAPLFLGPAPSPPPPLEALPENARLAQSAIGAALGNLFDPPVEADQSDNRIKGVSVSSESYEGIARIINNPDDFHRLQQGDVLVTRNTSASFNVVLPMLGAIVTDRGGQLSHAAIIAREYGIPAVVSTRNATRVIEDGARVRVDGKSGTVTVLS